MINERRESEKNNYRFLSVSLNYLFISWFTCTKSPFVIFILSRFQLKLFYLVCLYCGKLDKVTEGNIRKYVREAGFDKFVHSYII